MGDHRADIKIDFTFHGKTYKMYAWINWSPDCEGDSVIDPRVVEFFRESYEDAMDRYHAMVYESEREQREKVQREQELATLKTLKEKYPDAL